MNVAGPTKPTVDTSRRGVVEAWRAAAAAGAAPSAILLQECTWSDRNVGQLQQQLAELTGSEWPSARQWTDAGGRDAVVLYDAAVYAGKALSAGQAMQQASKKADQTLGALPAASREVIVSYKTRWAGAQLAPLDPATRRPSRLNFLLVSYHGREKRRKTAAEAAPADDRVTVRTLESAVKVALAQDFVAEVARAGSHAGYVFGDAPDRARSRGVPGLIAGDWNVPLSAAFYGFEGLAAGAARWGCAPHGPRVPPGVTSVRTSAMAIAKETIDFAVAVTFERDHALACDLSITDCFIVGQGAGMEGVFDHDPLVVQFRVAARHPDGATVAAPREAAVEAAAAIRRLSGKELRKIANGRPVSFKIDGKKALAAAPAGAAAPRAIVLARCPDQYDLAKAYGDYRTAEKRKKATKAMAADALGVEKGPGRRITDYAAAAREPWWPPGVASSANFDSMDDGLRATLYGDLQALLRERGVAPGAAAGGGAAVAAAPKAKKVMGNITFFVRGLTRLASWERGAAAAAAEP